MLGYEETETPWESCVISRTSNSDFFIAIVEQSDQQASKDV
jgi:hypothetical protein